MDRPLRLFLSYSHQDEGLLNELSKHLKGFERRGLIAPWTDRRITAGADWSQEIHAALNEAEIMLFLLSADFIASDYCNGVEVARALERQAEGTARLIPIFLRPCHLKGSPFLGMQGLPRDMKEVTEWPNQDLAFKAIAEGLEEVIGELRGEPPRVVDVIAGGWGATGSGRRRSGLRLGLVGLLLAGAALATVHWYLPHRWLAGAEVAYQNERLSDARRLAERAILWGPASGQAHWLAGLAAEKSSDLAGAEGHYRKAVTAAPDDPRYGLSLASLIEATGDPGELVRLLEPVAHNRPELLSALLQLADALRLSGDLSNALFYLRQIAPGPDSWQVPENAKGWYFSTTQGAIPFDTPAAKTALIEVERSLTLYLNGEPEASDAAFHRAEPDQSKVDHGIFDSNHRTLLAYRLFRLERLRPEWRMKLEGFRQRHGIPLWPDL